MTKGNWKDNNLLKHVERIGLNESKANIKKIKKIRESEGNTLDSNVKNWYCKVYPTDELGVDINKGLTFKQVIDSLNNGLDIYDIIGVGDSVVRERVFSELADITGRPYDDFYNAMSGKKIEFEESKKINKVKESIKGNTRQFVLNVVDYLNEFMEDDQDWLDMENEIIDLKKYDRFNSLNGAIKKYVEGARLDVYDNQVREALNRLYMNTPEEARRWEKYPNDKVWERYVNVMCMYIPKAFKLRMGRELGSEQTPKKRVNEGRVKDNFTDKTEAFIDDMVNADLPNGDLQGAVELFAMQNGLDDDMLLDIIRDRQRELNESKMKEKYWKDPNDPKAREEKNWWLHKVKVSKNNIWENDGAFDFADNDAKESLKWFGKIYVDTETGKPVEPNYVKNLIAEWGDK